MIIIKDYCVGLFSVFLRVVFFFFPHMHKTECSQFVNLVAETFFFSGHSILAQTRGLSAPQRKEKLVLSDLNAANTFLPCEYVVLFCLKKDAYAHMWIYVFFTFSL